MQRSAAEQQPAGTTHRGKDGSGLAHRHGGAGSSNTCGGSSQQRTPDVKMDAGLPTSAPLAHRPPVAQTAPSSAGSSGSGSPPGTTLVSMQQGTGRTPVAGGGEI